MKIKRSASFTEQEFKEAGVVAAYQSRTFARYIVHCVNIETKRRLEQALREKVKHAALVLSLEGKPP